MTRQILDKFQNKLISRKLLVWLTSTGMILSGVLDSEHWVWISLVYIGSEAATNIVAKIKSPGGYVG